MEASAGGTSASPEGGENKSSHSREEVGDTAVMPGAGGPHQSSPAGLTGGRRLAASDLGWQGDNVKVAWVLFPVRKFQNMSSVGLVSLCAVGAENRTDC